MEGNEKKRLSIGATYSHSIAEHDKALAELSANSEQDIFENIPVEFHPAINLVAGEIASTLGWGYPNGYNFLDTQNSRAVEMCRLAIVSISALQDFCLAEWGTSLADLVDKEE